MATYIWNCERCNHGYAAEGSGSIAGLPYKCKNCGDMKIPASVRVEGAAQVEPALDPAALYKMIGTPVGGAFVQADRMKGIAGHDELKTTVSNGYCGGIVLDWLRRVIQGGCASYDVAANAAAKGRAYTPEQINAREQAQTLRGANAWQTRYRGSIRRLEIAERQAYQSDLLQVTSQLKSNSTPETFLSDLARLQAKMSALYEEITSDADNVDTLPAEAQSELIRQIRTKEAKYVRVTEKMAAVAALREPLVIANNAKTNEGVLRRHYALLAAEMDEYEQQRRMEANRSKTKRLFSSLEALSSSCAVERPNIEASVNELLGNANFQPNRGAVFSIDEWGKDKGHAVGIYRLNNGAKYHLFDPNYGVKEVTREQLIAALHILFGDIYKYTSPTGAAKADYTIFGAKGTNDPVAAPVQHGPRLPSIRRVTGPSLSPGAGGVTPSLFEIVQRVQNVPAAFKTREASGGAAAQAARSQFTRAGGSRTAVNLGDVSLKDQLGKFAPPQQQATVATTLKPPTVVSTLNPRAVVSTLRPQIVPIRRG